MTTKNFFGGAIINYGAALPTTTGVPDGALFFKTTTPNPGLYVFNFVSDTNSGVIGDQSGQLWSPLTGPGASVDAATLDGLDSTAFQQVNSLLSGVINLGTTTGVVVKTGATTFATRTITAANSTISVSNGDGTTNGDITIGVSQSNLSLNSIGGTLSLSKGGTGTSLSITQGGIIYGASVSTLASTGAGTAGWLLKANGTGAPSWMDPSTITVGTATSAGSASSAGTLNPGRNINGTLFTGASDITITANTPSSVTFTNTAVGAATAGSSFNGSASLSVTYSTVGAPSATGVGASGTWNISILGSAGSAATAGSAGSATTAGSAATLTTARNFSITGGATAAAVSFNGGADVSLNVTSLSATSLSGTINAARLPSSATMNITGAASDNVLKGGDAMTGPLRLSSGSASAPSLTFDLDTGENTGLFLSAENEIGITTGGTTRLTISSTLITAEEPIQVPNPSGSGYVEVGFRRVPLATMTSGTLTTATSGCAVAATGSITVPQGVFSGGDTITIYNDTSSSITIIQQSGLTLYGDAAATGNKTVPPRGMVTIWFRSSAVAKITGEMS